MIRTLTFSLANRRRFPGFFCFLTDETYRATAGVLNNCTAVAEKLTPMGNGFHGFGFPGHF
ncbi:MAG TPA: hypothetical protein PKO06_10050 [Candidatus Ozemobacteraceae bacterium]|nr:hypothetical protein [Candidatus Ozemobacteraceae bacterium]